MHDDLRGELFNKIGADDAGNPEEMLNRAINEFKVGDAIEAKKIFKEVISITSTNALRYEGQSQHRAAAQAYYFQAVANEYMQQTSERDSNYAKVIDGLLAYAKSALTFDENERGITSATLAGLVCIIAGNNNRALEIFNSHMEIAQTKQNSQGLIQLLYSLGYLLDALQNTNVTALSDAQNYISKDLAPSLTPAKLTGFNSLMQSVVKYTQDVIESRIKMPKITVDTVIPKDILFNDIFEVTLNIENTGDGDASNVVITTELPEDLEIINGQKQVTFDKMTGNDKKVVTYSLRFQTAQDISEVVKQIKGNISYVDMLNNGHKQYVGPLDFEIRSISKTAEYMEKLDKMNTEYNSVEYGKLYPVVSMLLPAIKEQYSSFSNTLKQEIESQEFDNADFGFKVLDKLVENHKSLIGNEELSKTIESSVSKEIDTAVAKITEELTEKYTKEKAEAIAKLTAEKDAEKKEALDKLKSELMEAHETEINNMKEEHFKELGKVNQSHENKLNKHLADLEQSLEAKFVKEGNEKSDEFEKTMRELRTQHENELEEVRIKLKKDLKDKYSHELDALSKTKNEEIRKMQEAHEANLENSMNAQKIKLEAIKNEEIEEIKRRLEGELKNQQEKALDEQKRKFNETINLQNKKIDDLERQVRDLKSSSK